MAACPVELLSPWERLASADAIGLSGEHGFPLGRFVPLESRRARLADTTRSESMKALPILNEKATGIDVGSELLHVSIGGGVPKVFHTLTREVQALVGWLREEGVGTVAMEATGV